MKKKIIINKKVDYKNNRFYLIYLKKTTLPLLRLFEKSSDTIVRNFNLVLYIISLSLLLINYK